MGIKKIDCCGGSSPTFPKLMKHKNKGGIALFSHKNSCVLIALGPKSTRDVGDRLEIDNLYTCNWEDYNEPLTIQNT